MNQDALLMQKSKYYVNRLHRVLKPKYNTQKPHIKDEHRATIDYSYKLPDCINEAITEIKMDKAIYEGCNNVVSDTTKPQRLWWSGLPTRADEPTV